MLTEILKHRLVIIILTLFLAVLGGIIIFQIFLSLAVSEKQLKNSVSIFFKNNFNKAIEFEDIGLDLFGNVVISKLNISNSNDFNDNLNLIKSTRTKIKFDLFALLKTRMLAREILFYDSDITLYKKYGISYEEFLKGVFNSKNPLASLKFIDLNNFKVRFKNCRIFYIEGFKEIKLVVESKKVSSYFCLKNEILDYKLSGMLIPFRKEDSSGSFNIEGYLTLRDLKDPIFSTTSVNIENFDTSYFNPFLTEHFAQSISVNGGATLNAVINTLEKNISIDGVLNLDNLNIAPGLSDRSSHIISNENLNVEISLDILNDFQKFKFKKVYLNDDAIQLWLSGEYANTKNERFVNLAFHSNKIDLSVVSNYFCPVANSYYNGFLSLQGKLAYDIRHNTPEKMQLSLILSDFSLLQKLKNSKSAIVNDLNCSIELSRSLLDINFSSKKGNSDVKAGLYGFIQQWIPLISRSDINIYSDKMDFNMITGLLYSGINNLYSMAYEDYNRGYEEIYFLQKPSGFLANNNNLNCKLKINNILLENKNGFKDLNINALLLNGNITLNNFSLTGYDAEYALDVAAYLKTDHPNLSIKGKIKNLNMEKIAKDSGASGEVRGNLTVNFDYEMNGYRLSHFLENAKGNLNISLESAYLNGTVFQKRFKDYFSTNGISEAAIDNLTIANAAASISQQGDNFYISNFVVNGNRVNFNAFGAYDFTNGLKIPVNMTFIQEIEKDKITYPKTTNIQTLLIGRLSNPLLNILNKKDSISFSLLNID